MSLIIPAGNPKSPESVRVWRFRGVPKCAVCEGMGYRRVPRNSKKTENGTTHDLVLRECATCAGTGDGPDQDEVARKGP